MHRIRISRIPLSNDGAGLSSLSGGPNVPEFFRGTPELPEVRLVTPSKPRRDSNLTAVLGRLSCVETCGRKEFIVTRRILDYIAERQPETPCLVLDLNVVRDNFLAFRKSLPMTEVFYAVKANPDPAVLSLLSALGSSFDTASVAEIEMALEAGAGPDRISFGNTIKKERDIAKAYARGIRLFAADSVEEVGKIARAAPGSEVFCRILTDGEGAEWPLSRKFGCVPSMAVHVLKHARALGLKPSGVSFHVGSQQTDLSAWDRAISDAKDVFVRSAEEGIELGLLNMGGGFPTRYLKDIPDARDYGDAIESSIRRHFGNKMPRVIIEPGRGMVGNAGVICSEVVLVAKKACDDPVRWVYLDVGKFGGLAETMDEAIRYPVSTSRDGDDMAPCVLAGPTCDSADVLYERMPYPLPMSLSSGDKVLIGSAGAYTTTYASIAFNGFRPLDVHVLPASGNG